MLDLVVKDGLFFDGLGSAPVRRDVGVVDGRVAVIAPEIGQPAREVVDAAGRWVAPGFLDIHTHYDLELEIAPSLLESVRHGVTSVVIGNCSLSLAVGEPATLADIFQRVETLSPVLIEKWLRSTMDWQTAPEYLRHIERLPLGANVAALLGHSALRAHVMGLERSLQEPATDGELEAMRRLAEEALGAGFAGISIDMVPWHMMSGEWRGRTIPSQHADFREYEMLAGVCRRHDAVFQVTPNPQRRRSLFDIYRLSLGLTRPPLRITVLAALDSVADRRLWRAFRPMLFVLNRLLRCNVRFQTLTEPFTVYSDGPVTPLFEEFPCGVRLNDCRTREERGELWQSPPFREKFKRQWTSGYRNTFHRRLDLMRVVSCPDPSLAGKTFAEAARAQGREAVELFVDLLARYDTDLRWVATGANDRPGPRRDLMRQEFILPGFTDAGAHVQNLGYYDGALSLLKQAVQSGFLTPEKAISRVTGEPARWFRLDTGVLREGARADFILLDPDHLHEPISEQTAIADPVLDGAVRMVKRDSERIVEAVFVNGCCVFRDGEATAALGRESLGELLTPALPSPVLEKAKRRNRINRQVEDHPFTDYWDIFVLKHQHPVNIALHALGVVIFYGLLVAALWRQNFWLLLLLPSSQLAGLLGHRLFERSYIDAQDAVFSLRASRSLNRMFYRILTGRYGDEMRQKKAVLREYLQGREGVRPGPAARPNVDTTPARRTLPAIGPEKKWAVAAASYVAFCLFYTLTGNLHLRSPVELAPSALDQQIPSLAWTVWIYHSQFFLLTLAVAVLKKTGPISRTLYAMGLASMVSFLTFALYPTVIPRAGATGAGLTAAAFALLYGLDSASNCLPSLHVSLAWLAAAGVLAERRRVGAVFCLWAGLITWSTMTTKQHYLVDVVAGLGLAVICRLVATRFQFTRAST